MSRTCGISLPPFRGPARAHAACATSRAFSRGRASGRAAPRGPRAAALRIAGEVEATSGSHLGARELALRPLAAEALAEALAVAGRPCASACLGVPWRAPPHLGESFLILGISHPPHDRGGRRTRTRVEQRGAGALRAQGRSLQDAPGRSRDARPGGIPGPNLGARWRRRRMRPRKRLGARPAWRGPAQGAL